MGVSLSKVLAKIGSKHKKPRGLTVIPGRDIHPFLRDLPVGKVWGIGPNTAAFLAKFGITTALQFARADETLVFAQLSKNLENACIRARRYRLAAARLIAFLRQQDFRDQGVEVKLTRATAYPVELFGPLRECFRELFRPDTPYRQTGVVLAGLVPEQDVQFTLFDDMAKSRKTARVYSAVDELSRKFGKYAVQHGTSMPAQLQSQHEGARGDVPVRKSNLFKGENKRQRPGLPMLHIKV